MRPSNLVNLSRSVLAAVVVLALAGGVRADTNSTLLIVHPQAWEGGLTDFVEFKTRLGFDVTNATLEDVVGTGAPLLHTNAPPQDGRFYRVTAQD